ncbi:MAG: hypothetical protein KAT77_03175 [Nanoarchaeota archaeon]|nr:hypothetical protein [Nanoarchaeota archaeon]
MKSKKRLLVLLFLIILIAACAKEPIVKEKKIAEETCKNECEKEGKYCIEGGYIECGNFDIDSCLEVGLSVKCPENSYCVNSQCIKKEEQPSEEPIIEPTPEPISPSTTCQTNLDCDDNNASTVDKCFTESGLCAHDSYVLCQTNADCDPVKLGFPAKCYDIGEISACLTCSSDDDCRLGYCQQEPLNRRKCISRLKGQINVGVIEFKSLDTQFSNLFYCDEGGSKMLRSPCFENSQIIEEHNFLDVFNNQDGEIVFDTFIGEQHALSVYYLPTYIENQAQKYGITDLSINLDVEGPFDITAPFPEAEWTTPIGRPVIGSDKLLEFFTEEINKQNIDTSNYDFVFILFFDDWDLKGRETKFTSTANFVYTFINVQTSGPPGVTDDPLEAMIHEFIHLFEAFDKYIEPCPRGNYWSCCKDPDGLVEPNKIPKYPQNKACLMCGGIPLNEDGESQAPQDLFEVEICDKTAEEIGWK